MGLFTLELDAKTKAAIAGMAESVAGIREELRGIREELRGVREELRGIRFCLGHRPGIMKIVFLGEDRNMLQFKVLLPLLASGHDVASRELTVQIDDGEAVVYTVAADVLEVDGLSGEQDATVLLTLVDIDDADNRSIEPSTLEAVLTDTIPPAKPGELSLVVTGETPDVIEE